MNKKTEDYLKRCMGIDLNHLSLRLSIPSVQASSKSIHDFLDDVTIYYSRMESKKRNSEYVVKQFCTYETNMKTEEARITLDSLQHAFRCFSEYSIKNLYLLQENEDWYPKIVLTTVLDVNDLRNYPDDLNIYRGCDVSELNHESYGQSWSLCKSVAKAFAYENYSSQQWFNSGTRKVLEAKINKSDVYLAVLDQPEKEVVVNTRKLKHVVISEI